VPACRVGDSACDPEDDVNGYCCPEGTITGGSSIEDVMLAFRHDGRGEGGKAGRREEGGGDAAAGPMKTADKTTSADRPAASRTFVDGGIGLA
jgi:hypothetical protein